MPTSITSCDRGRNELSYAFDGANTRRLAHLDHRIADDSALAGMNDARPEPSPPRTSPDTSRTQHVPQ